MQEEECRVRCGQNFGVGCKEARVAAENRRIKGAAKQLDDDPAKLGTFQLLLGGGWELVKAYSELNDPIAQRKAFEEQEGLFRQGLADAQRMDGDFLEALEYGMPPTAGFGMGIDRLVALLTNTHSLREVILFPTMRPRDG